MQELAGHLRNLVLFAVNTGLRDDNVVGLQWVWEQNVSEIGRSVFVVPASHYKTGVAHVVILNDVAWSIVNAQRGRHSVWVFPYTVKRGGQDVTGRLYSINNGGFQRARERAGLPQVRVHDLRHTFATRLRLAGVAQEDRNVLMGHGRASMPEHYASADIGRLVDLANRVIDRGGTRTILRTVAGESRRVP
jgi:integrase